MSDYLTNVATYRAIAEEAQAQSEEAQRSAIRPKPDGSPGNVITFDPDRRSFKQSLIAITFAGIYLEALLYLLGTRKHGERWLKEFDRGTYESKLNELGVTDSGVLEAARRLREARNEIVHEKAIPFNDLTGPRRTWAQHESAAAVEFIRNVSLKLERAA